MVPRFAVTRKPLALVVHSLRRPQDVGHGRDPHQHLRQVQARQPVSFTVEPEEVWKTVVLNRWKKLCPSCFDLLAEQSGVAYSLRDLEGMSWSEKPVPRHGSRRKRQR